MLFGAYEQDNDLSNGKEPIEWIVLGMREGKALLISRYALDCQPYNSSNSEVTWETCTLRAWLNDTFLNSAFTKEEQARIPMMTVSADKNPNSNTDPGNSTEDQVFLLSIDEAKKYFDSNEARICEPSNYTLAQRANSSGSNTDGKIGCWWWLRSPGNSSGEAADINYTGFIISSGQTVDFGSVSVRPALWIDLDVAGTEEPSVTSGQENSNSDSIDQHDVKELKEASVGNYVLFGNYEQDNDLTNGKESIEWQVLAKEEDRILVISKYALDCQQYHTQDTIALPATWAKCTLRTWLNETFLKAAFSSEEQAIIPTVTVSADKNPDYNTSPGSRTQDQIFLLSITEANKYFDSDDARKCVPTDYAIAQGAYTDSKYQGDSKATCWWWLRSPGFDSHYAALVIFAGSVSAHGNYVCSNKSAVRPAMWIDLNKVG